MDKVQKHNSFNTNTPSSESYKNDLSTYCVEASEHTVSPNSAYRFCTDKFKHKVNNNNTNSD
jgi:hypothetical protein